MPTFHDYRIEARLSLTELARKANVDFRTAKRAESGQAIQELKAFDLVRVLSEALGRRLTVQDIDDMQIF